jgi:peptidoglycan/xylan/chitin deacetylase (PgdA/CDA1 family)
MRLPAVLPLVPLLAPGHSAPIETPALAARDVAFGSIITQCTVPGTVALTFDDGPYYHTPHILDLLDQAGAKATFFINGDNWSENIDDESTPWPETLRRMVNSGHQIGSHTWSHVDMTAADSSTRADQMQRLEKTLIKVIGKRPTYFRPPYASCEGQCLVDVEKMGYHVINFDLDTKDYANNTPERIGTSMEAFSSALSSGSSSSSSFLVLAHDVHEQTATALTPFMLEKIKQGGYRAVTVGECLGDPEANWYKSS